MLQSLKQKIEYSQQIQKLALRKGLLYSNQALKSLFQVPLPDLTSIVLDQCELLDTSAVLQIAKNCKNLQKLSVQWCIEVRDEAIAAVIVSCPHLKSLDCTGLKNLTGDCVRSALETEDAGGWSGLRSMRYMSFQQCNQVEDSVLEQCFKRFPKIEIRDFYN